MIVSWNCSHGLRVVVTSFYFIVLVLVLILIILVRRGEHGWSLDDLFLVLCPLLLGGRCRMVLTCLVVVIASKDGTRPLSVQARGGLISIASLVVLAIRELLEDSHGWLDHGATKRTFRLQKRSLGVVILLLEPFIRNPLLIPIISILVVVREFASIVFILRIILLIIVLFVI